ncbi:MAG: 1-acyl-sn-glycerol-3-phosphate acyltransferase [Oscillospiraceae bacterium]|nr:1-acyl-sn-glycerol-3-phosphate acyltransferase [Oscillospiraceae bacterium]
MKIKTKKMDFEKAYALPRAKKHKPLKPNILFRTLIRVLALPDLWATRFSYTEKGMDKIGKSEPCLILMNHSSFIDLKIASRILYPRAYNIVCTSDGFVGKELLMRLIGCTPTTKFVSDTQLIRNMQYALKENKTSVLMYPEAGYSFDGTATALPRRLGALLKRLDVPVISIITSGAFSRDPLYNGLRLRKVKVSAEVCCLLTREQIAEKSVEEIDKILDDAFAFDGFKWQKENNIEINEPFRAEGLERILYKCAACGKEGGMQSEGTELTCKKCGKKYHLNSLGELEAQNGETEFSHIPDWYAWQRECVKNELESRDYSLETEVDIGVLVDHKALYMVGDGVLRHDENGFALEGCGGKLSYTQKPLYSYGLNADYFWYEIGDVICIGTRDCLYYCFPKDKGVSVAKARLAAEELYKIKQPRREKVGAAN